MAMECLRRAVLPNQMDLVVEVNVSQATKLMRTFASLTEVLSRYRGKGAQKMIVEHVHVHKGGQAIVGPVSQHNSTNRGCDDRGCDVDEGDSRVSQSPVPSKGLTRNPKLEAIRSTDGPQPTEYGLKNGNATGDPSTAPRCGAKTRLGKECKAPAMRNGRCRMHGGSSTGPRTPEGLARSRNAHWKHGLYSAEAKAEARFFRQRMKEAADILQRLK